MIKKIDIKANIIQFQYYLYSKYDIKVDALRKIDYIRKFYTKDYTALCERINISQAMKRKERLLKKQRNKGNYRGKA